jgi:hypothetical protein
MGLLDDAIREHLDLKRRRGADPAEVARAEHEALGPVRRDPAPTEADEQPPEQSHAEHPAAHPAEPVAAAPAPTEPSAATHEPEPAEEPEPPPHHDHLLQPTTEFRVEDHHDDEHVDEAAEHDEDVLEETPDFLQETPEHDRLWFEQRPPRDFDFDG